MNKRGTECSAQSAQIKYAWKTHYMPLQCKDCNLVDVLQQF